MFRPALVFAAVLTLSIVAGCPPCDGWPDPNNPNFNEPGDPVPLTTTGSFTAEIAGEFRMQIDGVEQDVQPVAVFVTIELDQGRLISVRPFGPASWSFSWVDAATVTDVGDTDQTQVFTNTSHLNETVSLTSFDVDDERIAFTINVEFSSRRGMNAETINGNSTQTFELRPDGENLDAIMTGTFDFTHVTQNPSTPGFTTQRTQQFSGEGVMTPAAP